MKTNFLKHLTALVFLFCVALSARAEVEGYISSDRREVTFIGSGVLTRSLAQSIYFRQATTIRINGSVEEIEGNAFDNYTRLQNIIIENDKNTDSKLIYGSDPFLNTGSSDIAVYLNREYEWKNYDPNKSLEEQGYKGLFQDCPGIIGVYVNPGVFRLPERSFYNAPDFKYITIDTYGCRIIGEEAFRNCPLHTTIKLPEGLKMIEKNAFNGCQLANLYIPTTLEEIGDCAFQNCKNLIDINNRFQKLVIGYEWEDDYWTEWYPEKLTTIGERAFENCEKLFIFRFSNSIEEIKPYTFAGCKNLLDPLLPESLKRIGEGAFMGCESDWFQSIKIPSKVTSIEPHTFESCLWLKYVTMNNVQSIGEGAFYDCINLIDLSFPKSLTEIGASAFERCLNLWSVSIPRTVQRVQTKAFMECRNLKKAYVQGSTEVATDAFPQTTEIIYNDTYESWLNGVENKASVTELYIPNDIIANHHFDVLDNLGSLFPNVKKVEFGKDVTTVGDNIFCMSNSLESVEFTSKVSVGKYAFYNNKKLTKITGDENMRSCGDYSFAECPELTSLSIGQYCESIATTSFHNCPKLAILNINSQYILGKDYELGNSLANQIGGKVGKIVMGGNVASVGAYAFANATTLSQVTIGSGVKTIGTAAFKNCASLTKVAMPQKVTSIGVEAFAYCSQLANVNIPNGVTSIEKYTFRGCSSLKSIAIPTNVTSIGYAAFYECDICPTLNIPSNVETIGDYAFGDNQNLRYAYISGNTSRGVNDFPSATTVVYTDIADQDLTYDQWLERYPDGNRNEVTELYIPGNNVSNHSYATNNNLATMFPNVTNVVFGPMVTAVGGNIFSGATNLKNVEFRSNVKIGPGAFYNNKALNNITSEKIVRCDAECFRGCEKLSSMNLMNSDALGQYAFKGCTSLESISVSSTLVNVGTLPFDGCTNLKSLYIDNAALLAKNYTTSSTIEDIFGGHLETLEIGDNVTNIGDNAFHNSTTLKEVIFGKGVTKIYKTAFNTCRYLTKVRFNGDAITHQYYHEQDVIAERFPWLEEVTFGSDVTSVGNDMFNVEAYAQGTDYSLRKVTFLGDQRIAVGAYAFSGCNNLSTIEGDIKSVGVRSFANTKITRISIIDDAEIETQAFLNCTELTEAYLPYTLETIGKSAFEGCTNLNRVNMPSYDQPMTIGEDAFKNCTSLEWIEFPENLKIVHATAFAGCSALSSVRINGNTFADGDWWNMNNQLFTVFPYVEYLDFGPEVTSVHSYICYAPNEGNNRLKAIYFYSQPTIGKYAFYGCKALTQIDGEGNIKSVGEYSFAYTKISEIHITNDTEIETSAFEGCNCLEEAYLPSNLETIGVEAFTGCSMLNRVNMPSVVTIKEDAFANCTSLEWIELPANLTTVDVTAFNGCEALGTVVINGNALANPQTKKWDRDNNLFDRFKYIEHLYFGPEVENVGDYAFYSDNEGNPLKSIYFYSESAIGIGSQAFISSQNLEKVTGKIGSLGTNAFSKCKKLPSITLAGVTSIPMGAFSGCSALKEIEIPASVTSLGNYAFMNCTSLKKVICNVDKPLNITDKYVFSSVPVKEAELLVPVGSIEAYKNADVWKDFDIFAIGGVKLVDGQPYTNEEEQEVSLIRYTRNFGTTMKWQQLYVPFSMSYNDWNSQELDVARINAYYEYDDDEDGVIDRHVLQVMKVTEANGALRPNHPYLVRAREAGSKRIEVTNTTLNKADENSIVCSTTETRYVFTGTYKVLTGLMSAGYYYLSNGVMVTAANDNVKVNSYRWYLRRETKDGQFLVDDVNAPSQIAIRVIGEDFDETSIEVVDEDMFNETTYIYNLNGQKVSEGDMSNLPAGVYIRNNKKIYIK